jgi:hypothetical protein
LKVSNDRKEDSLEKAGLFHRIRKHKLRVEMVQLHEPAPTAISLFPAESKSDSFSEAPISYGAKQARSAFLDCPAAAPNLSIVSLLPLKPKSGFKGRSFEVQDVQVQTCEVHGCTNKGVATGRRVFSLCSFTCRDLSLPTPLKIERSPSLFLSSTLEIL